MASSSRNKENFTVAVDVMGGDFAPAEPVAGAVQAAREQGVNVLLVGDANLVEAELARHVTDGLNITIVPSEGVITETDNPVKAIRDRPKASMVEAAKLVKSGQADAMVTMGSTGAAMASATLVVGLLDGVARPALGGPMFRPLSSAVLIDVGSSVDCRPSQMLGFAALGTAFARSIQKIENPRVGLLSVGAEEGKGNRQTKEAYPVFKGSNLNFIGNVEGWDFFQDKVDVVVCDGFVGNIIMKFAEGMGIAVSQLIPGLVGDKLSPEVVHKLVSLTSSIDIGGGGPLFGVDGLVLVGHGRAQAAGIAGAIALAQRARQERFVEAMRRELAGLL